MTLPDYINCKEEKIIVCNYYMTSACKETCAYARDIGGLGIGTMTEPPRIITKEISDKLFEEDMKDY